MEEEASEEDLELLLSLQDAEAVVPETPSHSQKWAAFSGVSSANVRRAICLSTDAKPRIDHHVSDGEDLPARGRPVSMAAFKDVVASSLEKTVDTKFSLADRPTKGSSFNCVEFDKHSGLRIKDRLVTSSDVSNRLLDIRFVRLQAIRMALWGENITGAWATIGVLVEKGQPKVCSTGKNFVIWKLASLDSTLISTFLFGDAYLKHWKESAGSVLVVFNAKVRRDEKRKEPILSVFSADQIMKLGTSADYGICKGLRKDGTPCSIVINRRHGQYCQYHTATVRQTYKTKRAEIAGGNLSIGFGNPHKFERAQALGTVLDSASEKESMKAVKHMTSKQLKKVLCNADKVTTKLHSQGIRFLTSLAEIETENLEGNKILKRKNIVHDGPSKRRVLSDLNSSNASNFEKESSTNKKSMTEHESMELDLDGPDDALEQAIALFQKG